MIIQELNRYYDRLIEDKDSPLPKRFWSIEKVAWEFRIDGEGRLLSITPLTSGEGKGMKSFVERKVPEHSYRSAGIKPFFLCDKAAYIVGLDKKRGRGQFEASRELHRAVLNGSEDAAAQAILAFFDRREDHMALVAQQDEELLKGGFAVFYLAGDSCYAHERPAIVQAWQQYCTAEIDAPEGQCSITGEQALLTRLFPSIPGVAGAQSSGASLVSFNCNAFESYGRKQAFNASMSEEAAFKSGTALKYVFSDRRHRCRMGETTIVFWSDRPAAVENELMLGIFGGFSFLQETEDNEQTKLIKECLETMKSGRRPEGLDHETRFFILGLAPNAARLAVRFFEVSSFGKIEDNFGAYLRDVEMVGVNTTSLYAFLAQTAPPGKSSKLPETMVNTAIQAMLTGKAFPQALYALLLSRTWADKGKRNNWDMGMRAAMLKACLARKARLTGGEDRENEGRLTVYLNEENNQKAYLLGRAFAIMEKIQQEAVSSINATITDRYISSAASTPNRVFPSLVLASQNHLGYLRKNKHGLFVVRERMLNEVIARLDDAAPWPKTLTKDEQGEFLIGYYQQKEALWRKKDSESENAEDADQSTEEAD